MGEDARPAQLVPPAANTFAIVTINVSAASTFLRADVGGSLVADVDWNEFGVLVRLVDGEDAGAGVLDKGLRLCGNLVATVRHEADRRRRGNNSGGPATHDRASRPPR